MEIYLVITRVKKNKDWTSIGINQECYKTMEQAIEFCKSRLSKEELERHEKAYKRGLVSWYEFDSKNYEYRIKVLNLK